MSRWSGHDDPVYRATSAWDRAVGAAVADDVEVIEDEETTVELDFAGVLLCVVRLWVVVALVVVLALPVWLGATIFVRSADNWLTGHGVTPIIHVGDP